MKHLNRKCKDILWYLTSLFVFSLCLGFLLELYLRYSEAHIVKGLNNSKTILTEMCGAEGLIEYTVNGKRLLPNVSAVIRNHALSKQDILIQTNSLGFRDKELPAQKGTGELRILVLGDSITMGDSLPAEQVYVERLQYYLNAASDKNIEVINAGITDIGLKDEIELLQRKGLSIKPDVVIIAFYLNDSQLPWSLRLGQSNESKNWLRKKSLLIDKIWLTVSYLNLLASAEENKIDWINAPNLFNWRNNKTEFLNMARMCKSDWGTAWEEASWAIIDDELNKLSTISKENRFKILLACFPVSFQVYADFLEDFPQQRLKKTASGYGFYYCDLLPTLRNVKDEDLFFDHCHIKKETNDIVGRAISDFIKEEALL